MGGHNLSKSACEKDIGIFLDPHLHLETHINKIYPHSYIRELTVVPEAFQGNLEHRPGTILVALLCTFSIISLILIR